MGSMVGAGILTTPAIVSQGNSSWLLILGLWLAGGAYALAGALSQAELAALYPEAGGDYVFLRHSFGNRVAFLCGWVSFTVGFSGALAALARACAQYSIRLGCPSTFGRLDAEPVYALLLVLALTGLNLLGVHRGALVQSALTVVKVALLVLLAAFAAAHSGETIRPLGIPEASSPALAAAMLAIVFSYSGWNNSIYVGGEISNPQRNLPLSLVAGTLGVTLLYVGFSAAHLVSTGGRTGGGDLAAAGDMALALFGAGGSRAVSALAVLVILGSIASMIVAGPRIAYAMALDGGLPSFLSRLNTRGVPGRAMWFQAGTACLFVLAGSLDQIIGWVGFAIVVFSALATGCIFVEARRGNRSPHYSIPLYPVPPILYIAISLVIAAYVVWTDPMGALVGAGFVLAGVPIYYLSMRGKGQAGRKP